MILIKHANNKTPTTFANCDKLDVFTEKFAEAGTVADISVFRTGAEAVLQKGNMVVLGGFDDTSYLNSAEVYSFSTNTWSSLTSFRVARQFFGAAVVKNFIFIAGGRSTNDVLLQSVESFNGKIWRNVNGVLPSGPRLDHVCVSFRNKLYVIGGYDFEYANQLVVDVYDPSTKKWTNQAVPALTTPRFLASAVVLH